MAYMKSFKNVRSCYQNGIKLNNKIKVEAKGLEKRTTIAKIVGICGSIVGVGVGAAGVVLIPLGIGVPMLGAGLAIGGGVGAAAGGIVVAGATIADTILKEDLRADLINATEQLNNAVGKHEKLLNKILILVDKLVEEGNSREESEAFIVQQLKLGVEFDIPFSEFSERFRKFKQSENQNCSFNSEKFTERLSGGVRLGAGIARAALAGVIGAADDIALAVFRVGGTVGATTGLRLALASAGVVLGVGFVVYDIVEVVKAANSPNILIEHIDKINKIYEDSIKMLDLIIQELDS